jgi:hypothetical protein
VEDTVDMEVVDIAGNQEEHTVEETTDADVVDDVVEDAERLHRRHTKIPYHKLADRSHHYSAEEGACNMHRTPLNDTTIGIIVSRVAST